MAAATTGFSSSSSAFPASSPSPSPSSSPSTYSFMISPRGSATARASVSTPSKIITGFPTDLPSSSSSSIYGANSALADKSTQTISGRFTKWRPSTLPISNYAYSYDHNYSAYSSTSTASDPWKFDGSTTTSRSSSSAASTGSASTPLSETVVPSIDGTHYEVLGVSPSASPREIRLAYRRLALQYHPDVCPMHQLDTSTKLFARINEAYGTLADPQKRAAYDFRLQLVTGADAAGGSSVYSSSPSVVSVHPSSPSPRSYSHAGRVYPSMNSFYREWRRNQNSN